MIGGGFGAETSQTGGTVSPPDTNDHTQQHRRQIMTLLKRGVAMAHSPGSTRHERLELMRSDSEPEESGAVT